MLGVRSVAHLPDLVKVSTANIQDNSVVLSAVIMTVPQFTSAYISDILVSISKVILFNITIQRVRIWVVCVVRLLDKPLNR